MTKPKCVPKLPLQANSFAAYSFKDMLADIVQETLQRPANEHAFAAERVIRDVLIGFFLLRKLIEDGNVTKKTTSSKVDAFECNFGAALIARINASRSRITVSEGGAFPTTFPKTAVKLKPEALANKFIHACYCSATQRGDYWHEFLVFDWDDHKRAAVNKALVVPVASVVDLFDRASRDTSGALMQMRAYLDHYHGGDSWRTPQRKESRS